MSSYMKIDWNSLFVVLFLFIYIFKVGIHQLALTLIKTSCNNKNTNKNQSNFLASLLLPMHHLLFHVLSM